MPWAQECRSWPSSCALALLQVVTVVLVSPSVHVCLLRRQCSLCVPVAAARCGSLLFNLLGSRHSPSPSPSLLSPAASHMSTPYPEGEEGSSVASSPSTSTHKKLLVIVLGMHSALARLFASLPPSDRANPWS